MSDDNFQRFEDNSAEQFEGGFGATAGGNDSQEYAVGVPLEFSNVEPGQNIGVGIPVMTDSQQRLNNRLMKSDKSKLG